MSIAFTLFLWLWTLVGSNLKNTFAIEACKQVVLDQGSGKCIPGVKKSQAIWTDRNYAFTTAPTDILSGRWGYISSGMDSKGPPCKPMRLDGKEMPEYQGGFQGTLKSDLVVGICCANHHTGLEREGEGIFPRVNDKKNFPGIDWHLHDGKFAISEHGGEPCTFFEAVVKAGTCKSPPPPLPAVGL